MEPVRFATEDGVSLEGEIRIPEGEPRGSAIICHAHPLRGGSRDHPLLWAVRNELARRGFATLGFDFRGVMRSGGSYGAGVKELEDVRAAVTRVRETADGPTLVCGWSFGANVALREAVTDGRVDALALIGVPLGESALDLPELPAREVLRRFARPVLLLVGAGDPFCHIPELENLARQLPASKVHVVKGTDHFLWRHEGEAAEAIGAFAEGILPS